MWALKHRWFTGVNSMVLPSRSADLKRIWFFDILHIIAIFIYLFRQAKNAKQELKFFFFRSPTNPTKTFGSWLTPPLHNLALSPRRSWFFKNSPRRLSTFESNLGILTLSECHEILDGESTWCKETTVQISSKSDKVKEGKSLTHCLKYFQKMADFFNPALKAL